MPDTRTPPRIAWWVTLLDAITCILTALAAWDFITGGAGLHGTIAGIRISLTSELRFSLVALLVWGIRHLCVRRPTLWQRIKPAVVFVRELGASPPLPRDPLLEGVRDARVPLLELGLVAIVMAGLTVLVTWPQAQRLDSVPDLGDPLFSLWRLKWIAHQLPRDPLHLFDGNIFYPERYTLAFSDSILLPGLLAAPLFWLGLPDTTIYNGWMLLTFALSGVTMYALVRALTRQPGPALVAAIIFAFYPFRFEHYSHFELQFSFWIPLVLLAFHRLLARARTRDGVLTGAAFGAQALSSLYLAVFLSAYMAVVGGAIALAMRDARRWLRPLVVALVVAGVMTSPLVVPYLQVRRAHGERSLGEMALYSAHGTSYRVAHRTNATYYQVLGGTHEPERELFPGLLAVGLALIAVWPPFSVLRLAYLLGLLFAFDASLGVHGASYRALAEHVLPFGGLRVPARFSIFVGASLAILAAFGMRRLRPVLRPPWLASTLAVALCGVVLFESRPTLRLEPVPAPHQIYRWFAGRPASVIAELPAADGVIEPRDWDVRYSYPATFHWQRMLNGNSGYFPPSHIAFCKTMRTFPDTRSISLLRGRGVDYVIVHEEYYGRQQYRDVVEAIAQRAELREVSRATDKNYEARIYRLLK